MSDRIPLSFLLTEHKDEQPPVEPIPGFAVFYNEEFWRLKTMLERTAVLVDVNDEYRTITGRFEYILVDPRVVEWQAKTGERYGAKTWRRLPAKAPADQSAREGGDQRAIASQERQRQREENERDELRRRSLEAAAAAPESNIDGGISTANVVEPERSNTPPILARRRAEGLANGERSSAGDGPGTGREPDAALSTVEPSSPPAHKVGTCVKCGTHGRLDENGVCTRHKPRAKRTEAARIIEASLSAIEGEKAANKIGRRVTRSEGAVAEPTTPGGETTQTSEGPATGSGGTSGSAGGAASVSTAPSEPRLITRPPRHRTRPEGCLVKCRPFRDDVYHAPGCPNRIEQLGKFNRKAPPTPGCKACEAPGRGIRHAVGCPHRRGPLSNAEMVQLAAGTLPTVVATADPAAPPTALALATPIELAPLPAIDHMPSRDDWLQLLVRMRAVVAENRVLKTSLRELYTDLKGVIDE